MEENKEKKIPIVAWIVGIVVVISLVLLTPTLLKAMKEKRDVKYAYKMEDLVEDWIRAMDNCNIKDLNRIFPREKLIENHGDARADLPDKEFYYADFMFGGPVEDKLELSYDLYDDLIVTVYDEKIEEVIGKVLVPLEYRDKNSVYYVDLYLFIGKERGNKLYIDLYGIQKVKEMVLLK